MATGRRKAAREAFLAELVDSVPIVVYDLSVAQAHIQLMVATRVAGTPRGAHGLIIATTARATGRTLVTADQSGFVDLPGVAVRAVPP